MAQEDKNKNIEINPFRSPKSPRPLRPGRCFSFMKTYSIDHINISKAVESLDSAEHLMANDCIDAAKERIAEASKFLHTFLDNDGLIEDNELVDGLVRQMEAKAAIKKAVEETENIQKKAIDMMVQMCKDTNAAKTTMSAKRPDGYIYETIVRKDGVVAFDEFTKEQLEEIRDRFAKTIYKRNLSPEEGAEKELLQELSKKDLDVINVCQTRLGCPEFSSLRQFNHNLSGWEKIDEILEATPEGLKEMCSACEHEGKCGIAPIKCWNEN